MRIVLTAGVVISVLIWHHRGEPTCCPSALWGAVREVGAAGASLSVFVRSCTEQGKEQHEPDQGSGISLAPREGALGSGLDAAPGFLRMLKSFTFG